MVPRPTSRRIEAFINQWLVKIKRKNKCDTLAEVLELGMCEVLAKDIWKYFNKSAAIKFISLHDAGLGHSWVVFNGKHYDMQNPAGVEHWKRLLYFDGAGVLKGAPDDLLDHLFKAASSPSPKTTSRRHAR
jgi:hypothetical protein